MEDVVAKAEQVMKDLSFKDKWGNTKISVKTSQIRKFLTAVTLLSNRITLEQAKNGQGTKLSDKLANEVKYLKIKIAYQAGRDTTKDKAVKNFFAKAGLTERIDNIGTDVEQFRQFARYVEALVAYHKFYGGSD